MNRTAARPRPILAAALIAACGGGGGDAPPADAGAPAPPPYNESTMPAPTPGEAPAPPAQATRPATRVDTIRIEGMPEPIRLVLFDGSGITPPFSTYVPEGLDPEPRRAEVGTGVDFTAHFGGIREPRARLGYFVYAEGMTRAQVNEQILGFTSGRRPRTQPEPSDRFPWSLLEQHYEFEGDDGRLVVGTIALGQRAGRWFHIMIQYPAEYGDGMGPRVERILRHWRWLDDGSPLTG